MGHDRHTLEAARDLGNAFRVLPIQVQAGWVMPEQSRALAEHFEEEELPCTTGEAWRGKGDRRGKGSAGSPRTRTY